MQLKGPFVKVQFKVLGQIQLHSKTGRLHVPKILQIARYKTGISIWVKDMHSQLERGGP